MKRCLALFAILLAAACETSGPDLKGADLVEAARVNTQLGVDYLRKGLHDQAIEKLERAVDQDPASASAHSALAFAYAQTGKFDEAEDEYRDAVRADPESPDIRNNFGVFLCRQDKLAEAEKNFLEAARHPRYKTPEAAWTNAGVCLQKTHPEKAENYFRQALERNREFPDALAQMAALSLQQKDYWRSRAFLQRYDAVAPPTAETLWIALQIEQALGNRDAVASYERRLKTEFPESEQASRLRPSPTGTP